MCRVHHIRSNVLLVTTQVCAGSITYAAAVAAGLGKRACIVTAAGPDADLSVFTQQELHVIPTKNTLTFEHTYTWWGNQRKLRVPVDTGVTLTADHVPWHCLMAKTVMLGPLIPSDVDAESFTKPTSLLRRALLLTQKVCPFSPNFFSCRGHA